jgi:hypothetical protein
MSMDMASVLPVPGGGGGGGGGVAIGIGVGVGVGVGRITVVGSGGVTTGVAVGVGVGEGPVGAGEVLSTQICPLRAVAILDADTTLTIMSEQTGSDASGRKRTTPISNGDGIPEELNIPSITVPHPKSRSHPPTVASLTAQ